MASSAELRRPAFYALRPGGWRDLLTLLHPPYTAWHLSYVAIGAAAAPTFALGRLAWTLAAFMLAVGIAAHALDEFNGRPLRTALSDRTLVWAGALALCGAVAIGVYGMLTVSAWLGVFVIVGVVLTLGYNLELLGGCLHTDLWFAIAWGAFPALTAYWAQAQGMDVQGVLVGGGCLLLSLAQRRLSTPVRELRRRTLTVEGVQRLADGRTVALDAKALATPMEGALMACAGGLVLLAIGLVAARL